MSDIPMTRNSCIIDFQGHVECRHFTLWPWRLSWGQPNRARMDVGCPTQQVFRAQQVALAHNSVFGIKDQWSESLPAGRCNAGMGRLTSERSRGQRPWQSDFLEHSGQNMLCLTPDRLLTASRPTLISPRTTRFGQSALSPYLGPRASFLNNASRRLPPLASP